MDEKQHCVDAKTCVCGYKYSYDYDDRQVVEGDEKFIDVDINATYEDGGGYYNQTKKLRVVMCPKCGTLKGLI